MRLKMKELLQELRQEVQAKGNLSAPKGSREIATDGKQQASAIKEIPAVSATMKVNVEKAHTCSSSPPS